MEDFKFGYVGTYLWYAWFSLLTTCYALWTNCLLGLEVLFSAFGDRSLVFWEERYIWAWEGSSGVLRDVLQWKCFVSSEHYFPCVDHPPWGDQVRFLFVVRVNCPNMEYMVRVVDHHEPLKVFAGNSFPTCVVITGENPKGRGTEKEPYIRTSWCHRYVSLHPRPDVTERKELKWPIRVKVRLSFGISPYSVDTYVSGVWYLDKSIAYSRLFFFRYCTVTGTVLWLCQIWISEDLPGFVIFWFAGRLVGRFQYYLPRYLHL